ncbi:2OG-Fe(II) oxygenase [Dongia soli]|uniref:2OG-Fe(II) oxygenase n=1 Tax=Dongia soli TaxID=600628 RepID=A0ABU5EAZ3_9PROT|nr:2OG-Fe(II) oxygenase [Dongia soli]MDY0882740.1 2OG-Fe(II) oxygenase [Dongia soli]
MHDDQPVIGTSLPIADQQRKKAIEAYQFLPPVALCAGDRFPNFFLPDQSGAVRSFIERAKGNAIALFCDPDDELIRQLTAAAKDYDAAALDRMAILGGSEADVATRAERLGADFTILADPAGKIRQQLREMTGKAGNKPVTILLDRQQRIVDLAGDGDLSAWSLQRWRREPVPEEGRRLSNFAPVLIVPNVLSPEDCRALIERWEVLGHEEGTVNSLVAGAKVERVHKAVKSRRDHPITDMAVLRSLIGVIGRRLAPELDRAFNFTRFKFDRFIITCYDAERNDYFRRHRDNQTPSTEDRRFALTLNLNTDDYDGGELIFPEYGNHLYSPPAGGAILFSCSLLHEALPVTRGQRFTLLSFLRN